jgi:23S rRNA (cytosine1962-C5)-methyltransferase
VELELLENLLEKAIADRRELFDARHETAFRLFNGFTEGCAALAVDLYATTVVLHDYADPPQQGSPVVQAAQEMLRARLPWLRAGVLKIRNSSRADERRGRVLFGEALDSRVREDGVWYAIDVGLNRDASLYLDTRNLRHWARRQLQGKTVLNTFAYTGSLGVAARAGGATRVVHLERNRKYLNVAKTSYTLNGFAIQKSDFLAGDFWTEVSRLKRTGDGFDCVFLDPPLFSQTAKGVVDLVHESARVINKVRPLINDGGYLVTINNAMYVSGREYMAILERLCGDGYLSVKELIPVSEDFIGYATAQFGEVIADPAPFNHSTKIAVLGVRRKGAPHP